MMFTIHWLTVSCGPIISLLLQFQIDLVPQLTIALYILFLIEHEFIDPILYLALQLQLVLILVYLVIELDIMFDLF